MRIGFIGLGNMGGPMAKNLAAAGHAVQGFDLAAPMPEGVTAAATAAEAAAGAEVVITMLPNGQILRAVAAEVIPAMAPGAVLCDCSTVDVDSARAVADQAAACSASLARTWRLMRWAAIDSCSSRAATEPSTVSTSPVMKLPEEADR